jgi:hypothetical protein
MSIRATANRSTTEHPAITITPLTGRVDERVHIRVVGLAASQQITLQAEQYDDTGNHWQAHAEFQADEHGVVDLDAQHNHSQEPTMVLMGWGCFGRWRSAPPQPALTRFARRR